MSNNKKSQRSRLVIFGLCSALALLICTGIVIGVALSMVTEGVYEFPEDAAASLTELPKNADDTVGLLTRLINTATDDKQVYLDKRTEVSVDEDSIRFSGNENELNALQYMKNKIYESIDGIYPENYEGKFSDGYKAYPVITLAKGDYTAAECVQGSFDEDGNPVLDEDGNPVDADCCFFNVTVPGGAYPAEKSSSVYTTFGLDDGAEIAQKIREKIAPVITVDKAEITPKDFVIEAKSDRLNDHILYANFIRNYSVSLTFTFVGEYNSLGTRTLNFDYCVSEYCDYTWAGLTLGESSISIKKNDSHPLEINAVMNDDSDYKISLKSSDESVATIDDAGYIYGVSYSDKPVTITVTLDYLGHSYSAECQVYVTVPVEKIVISDDEMSLKVGDSGSLSAKLTPNDATIDDIIWISENEDVVKVGSNGEITAVSAGKTTIIAVSADGHFRDSCAVTVTE